MSASDAVCQVHTMCVGFGRRVSLGRRAKSGRRASASPVAANWALIVAPLDEGSTRRSSADAARTVWGERLTSPAPALDRGTARVAQRDSANRLAVVSFTRKGYTWTLRSAATVRRPEFTFGEHVRPE